MVRTIPTMDATCWFLNPTQRSPSHSPSVTRITRNTSWTTVSTMTTNAPNPSAVPNDSGIVWNEATWSSRPTPAAKAPAPAPPAMATAVSDSSPSVFSENMPPPPTGSASVSYSNWRAVPTEPNSACQPEIAPQAMVTNNTGHSGSQILPASKPNPRVLTGCNANSPILAPVASVIPVNG